MSFLVLPLELKLKIFEMVDAQDKAYRARVERKHRQGEYGRGLRVLSVLSKEVRELVAPLLFSPLDLGRVECRHQADCLKSDALSSCRTLCLRMRDPRASSQDRAQDGRFLLRALCVAKEVQHVVVDLGYSEHWELVEHFAGPFPQASERPELLAWYARADELRTKGVWEFAETFAPEFRRRLADIHGWTFLGLASATWLGLVRHGIQETIQRLQLGQGSENFLSQPDRPPPLPVTNFKALQSLTLIDEQPYYRPLRPDVPAVAAAWLNWPHPLPLLTSLTLEVLHLDTSVLAFVAQFSHTLKTLHITGASPPLAQPTMANLPDFPSFTRLSLLRLSLPTIHGHTAVLQALEPHLPVLASLACASTAVTTSMDSAASPFPALFSPFSLPSLRHLRLDTAGKASQSASWPISLLSALRLTLSTRPQLVLLETGWSPISGNAQDPAAELGGAKDLLQRALRRVEGAEKVLDEREMRLLLEGMTKIGEVVRLLED
ncbi:hypothetical protein JCM10213v2_003612 [Rhodosporidiobolus nylandii]